MNYRKIHLFIFVCLILTSLVMGMEQQSHTDQMSILSPQAIVKTEPDGTVIAADIKLSYSVKKKTVKTSLVLVANIPSTSNDKKTSRYHYSLTYLGTILMCQATPYIKDDHIFFSVAAIQPPRRYIKEYDFKLYPDKPGNPSQHILFLDISKKDKYINLIEFIALPLVLKSILEVSSQGIFKYINLINDSDNALKVKIINWKEVNLPDNYKKFKAHPWSPHRKAISFEDMPGNIKLLCEEKYASQQYKLFLEKINGTIGHSSY